jgi:phosphate-selective porin O/P
MKNTTLAITAAALLTAAGTANAGAKIKINDDATINLGFRLQTLLINRSGDGNTEDEFKVRRARFRLGSTITDKASIFLQTDVSGKSMNMIDAFITLKPSKTLNIIVGENMVPASRQNLTSSAALMTMDRPGIAYKSLNWGGRALESFSNTTIGDTKAGLASKYAVRDGGATVFGKGDVSNNTHYKYYLGLYNGANNPASDGYMYSGRFQVNFGDAESGYYNASTYLGKKKTYSLGVSYTSQADATVEVATGNAVDYSLLTIDAFVEQPVANGSFTAEAAYSKMELDGAGLLSTGGNGKNSEGDGFYAQTGFLVNDWQVWAGYEQWDSTDANDVGTFDSSRLGFTYFMKGQNLNLKAGIEKTNLDWNGNSDTSFVLGAYVNF